MRISDWSSDVCSSDLIENAVLEEATAQVNPDDDIIVVAQTGWHHGVIGIVAGRLKESFNRPAIVIGIDEFGVGKGSGRSIAGVDLGRAIMDAVLDKKRAGGAAKEMAGVRQGTGWNSSN